MNGDMTFGDHDHATHAVRTEIVKDVRDDRRARVPDGGKQQWSERFPIAQKRRITAAHFQEGVLGERNHAWRCAITDSAACAPRVHASSKIEIPLKSECAK